MKVSHHEVTKVDQNGFLTGYQKATFITKSNFQRFTEN